MTDTDGILNVPFLSPEAAQQLADFVDWVLNADHPLADLGFEQLWVASAYQALNRAGIKPNSPKSNRWYKAAKKGVMPNGKE